MALVGLNGGFLRANPSLFRIFGDTEPDLLRLTFQDITHPGDLAATLAADKDLSSRVVQHAVARSFLVVPLRHDGLVDGAPGVAFSDGEPSAAAERPFA